MRSSTAGVGSRPSTATSSTASSFTYWLHVRARSFSVMPFICARAAPRPERRAPAGAAGRARRRCRAHGLAGPRCRREGGSAALPRPERRRPRARLRRRQRDRAVLAEGERDRAGKLARQRVLLRVRRRGLALPQLPQLLLAQLRARPAPERGPAARRARGSSDTQGAPPRTCSVCTSTLERLMSSAFWPSSAATRDCSSSIFSCTRPPRRTERTRPRPSADPERPAGVRHIRAPFAAGGSAAAPACCARRAAP